VEDHRVSNEAHACHVLRAAAPGGLRSFYQTSTPPFRTSTRLRSQHHHYGRNLVPMDNLSVKRICVRLTPLSFFPPSPPPTKPTPPLPPSPLLPPIPLSSPFLLPSSLLRLSVRSCMDVQD
jgi:hypothetical protein